MTIQHEVIAGYEEKGDILVRLSPNEKEGIVIALTSPVKRIFGDSILNLVQTLLTEGGVTSAKVDLVDMGALEPVIRARVKTVLCRTIGTPYPWDRED